MSNWTTPIRPPARADWWRDLAPREWVDGKFADTGQQAFVDRILDAWTGERHGEPYAFLRRVDQQPIILEFRTSKGRWSEYEPSLTQFRRLGEIVRYAQGLIYAESISLTATSAQLTQRTTRGTELAKLAERANDLRFQEAVVKLLLTQLPVVRASELNPIGSHHKLPLSDCVVDLKTSARIEPADSDPDWWLTRRLPSHYIEPEPVDWDQVCSEPATYAGHNPWVRFMVAFTSGDADVIRYLLRYIGWSFNGTPTKDFLLLRGDHDTGKSTFGFAVARMMGFDGSAHRQMGFAAQITGDKLVGNIRAAGHTDSLMPLERAHFVWIDELPKEGRPNELFQAMTGGARTSIPVSAKGEKGRTISITAQCMGSGNVDSYKLDGPTLRRFKVAETAADFHDDAHNIELAKACQDCDDELLALVLAHASEFPDPPPAVVISTARLFDSGYDEVESTLAVLGFEKVEQPDDDLDGVLVAEIRVKVEALGGVSWTPFARDLRDYVKVKGWKKSRKWQDPDPMARTMLSSMKLDDPSSTAGKAAAAVVPSLRRVKTSATDSI